VHTQTDAQSDENIISAIHFLHLAEIITHDCMGSKELKLSQMT